MGKRKRKQTEFFGEVQDSSQVEITDNKQIKCEVEDDSYSSGEDIKALNGPRKRQSVQRRQFQTVKVEYRRRSPEKTPDKNRLLEIHEVPFHPSLAKHRYGDS